MDFTNAELVRRDRGAQRVPDSDPGGQSQKNRVDREVPRGNTLIKTFGAGDGNRTHI
jgi:hypothetical protein